MSELRRGRQREADSGSSKRSAKLVALYEERRAALEAELLIPRVNRDPCFKCGIRADIGCIHTSGVGHVTSLYEPHAPHGMVSSAGRLHVRQDIFSAHAMAVAGSREQR